MNKPNRIEQLRQECERLLVLLKDPHPGLITWQEAVNRCRCRIADLPEEES